MQKRNALPVSYLATFDYFFESRELPLRIILANPDFDELHPIHRHEFTELVIVTAGHAEHLTDNGNYPLKSGDVFIVPEGCRHGYARQNNFTLINILFCEKRLPLPLWDFGVTALAQRLFAPIKAQCEVLLHLPPEALDKVQSVAMRIAAENQSKASAFRFLGMALFMELLVILSRNCPLAKPEYTAEHPTLPDVLEYLELHANEAVDFALIARKYGMSERNFYRTFKAFAGSSPHRYLIRLRLDNAERLLLGSDVSIDDIAVRCGFADRQAFAQSFRKRYNTSPGAYRRQKENG